MHRHIIHANEVTPMVSYRVLTVAALAGLIALAITPARAQDAPSLDLTGQVNGLCMLSQAQLIGTSKAGQEASKRLKALTEKAQREVLAMRQKFSKQVQDFQSQEKTLQPQQRQERQKYLQSEAQSIQRKGGELEQRLQLTRSQSLGRIVEAAKPLVVTAYKQHRCGILLDRDSGVLGGNAANDLTDEVVKALDKKMPSISFNLAPLPRQSNGK